MKIQITMYSTTGKYKPMSTLVEAKSVDEFRENFDEYKHKAISKILAQRYKDGRDAYNSGYTRIKWRIYDREERKKYAIEQIMNKRKGKC